MPTQVYRTKDGERVSGVTTIIGTNLGWNKEPLKIWAYNMGKDGKDLRKATQDACDAGTIAHAFAEADIKDQPLPEFPDALPEVYEKAKAAFGAYLQWKRMSRVELVLAEVAFVSEQHRFGGCIDAIGMIEGEACLIDFKTSNSTYSDHLIQIAAYKELWNEHNADTPVKACHLLRFGKENGDFAHHYYPNLDKHWEAFKHLLALHDLKKTIGKAG
jgi:hypothetical protein